MIHVTSAPACLAVDTASPLTRAQALTLASATVLGQQVLGVARYVPLPGNAPGGDITAPELDGLLSAGLGVWLVQHVRRPGWTASPQYGTDCASAAVEYAQRLGYLPGAQLCVDQEGCASQGVAVARYLEAWAERVIAAGFLPCVYEGFSAGLTAEQLYAWLPSVHAYWSDYGTGRAVATRGFQIVQHPQQAIAGLPYPFDADSIAPDLLGGSLRWMVEA